ncbi:YeeE/YedE family protein [Novosphingobium sp. 1949]|uniref:YeeE/YedE family protein n=1 Tax=Novosphingobium organovorum TaxID=2930092 RepID=A0ABT0BJN9_9SPHN|nr:YeeE/YedE thiosulfate transporter family protein [Novosphingobium organovorum]MCJ2185041.1 YeeE/YedE family protein [Novosphingobium organovorum]
MIEWFLHTFPHAQPLRGLAGGILIGLAGALMLLGAGRIAGISGLTARVTGLAKGGAPWPLAALFIAGLPLGALIVAALTGPIPAQFPTSLIVLTLAGVITGIGTRLGSGCTSGHGVCGLSRLSPRSIVATLTFIAAGMVTVALVNALTAGG